MLIRSLPCLFLDFPLTSSSFTVASLGSTTTEKGQGHYEGNIIDIVGMLQRKPTSAFLHMMVRSSLLGSNLNFFTLVFNPLLAQWGQYL